MHEAVLPMGGHRRLDPGGGGIGAEAVFVGGDQRLAGPGVHFRQHADAAGADAHRDAVADGLDQRLHGQRPFLDIQAQAVGAGAGQQMGRAAGMAVISISAGLTTRTTSRMELGLADSAWIAGPSR